MDNPATASQMINKLSGNGEGNVFVIYTRNATHDLILSRIYRVVKKVISSRKSHIANIKTTRTTFNYFVCVHYKNSTFKA